MNVIKSILYVIFPLIYMKCINLVNNYLSSYNSSFDLNFADPFYYLMVLLPALLSLYLYFFYKNNKCSHIWEIVVIFLPIILLALFISPPIDFLFSNIIFARIFVYFNCGYTISSILLSSYIIKAVLLIKNYKKDKKTIQN